MLSQRLSSSQAIRALFRTGAFLVAVSCAGWVNAALITTIYTSTGSGADTELREEESSRRDSAQDLNTRWESPPVNLEFIVLRFDLTGVNRSIINGASLQMIANRA